MLCFTAAITVFVSVCILYSTVVDVVGIVTQITLVVSSYRLHYNVLAWTVSDDFALLCSARFSVSCLVGCRHTSKGVFQRNPQS